MKQIFTLFFLFFNISLFAGNTNGFIAPTNPAQFFSVISRDGDRVAIQWVNGNGAKRIVVAKKGEAVTAIPVNGTDYNPNNAFGLGNEITTGEFVVYDGSANSLSIINLSPNTIYHFAIFEYNGSGGTIEYLTTALTASAGTLTAPSVQPTALSVTNINGHSMSLGWMNGPVTGNGRIVIARANAAVNINPVDLGLYTANNNFQSGTEIGSGNFVLYKGTGNSVNITGFEPNTVYHFAIFEYNGTQGLVYNTNNPPRTSATTFPRPSIPSSALNFLAIEGNRVGISMQIGNGAKRIIIARQGSPVTAIPVDGITYNGNTSFMHGDQISPGEYVLSAGISNSYNVTGLVPGTTYYFAVYEYDGNGNTTAYLTSSSLSGFQSTVSAPTIQASSISFSNILSTSLTINWNNGNGGKRLVVMRRDNPASILPQNLTYYSPSNSFGTGTTFGGGYAVFSNTGNSVIVSGLTAGATYHVSVFEYNGNNYPVYITADFPTQTVTTSTAPTLPPTALQFYNIEGSRMNMQWTNGNGNRRLIIARAGSPVSFVPVNNTSYTASTIFTSGQQVAPGEYVIFNGNVTNSLLLSNLSINTVYHIAVFEYNAVGANAYYLVNPRLTGNRSTAAPPTINSAGMSFSNVNGSSMKVNWTSGNGTNRLLLARKGSPVNALPPNLSAFSEGSDFSSGAEIGTGNYVVYNGNGNNKTVTGLEPGTSYFFTVIEYNGAGFPVYLNTGNLTGSQQTADRPITAASAVNFTEIEGNKIKVKWTSGNGSKRIVVASAGSPVTGLPADGVTYSANPVFGSGASLAPGEFIIANNNFSEVIANGLQPNTVYHFAVFEYDGIGLNTKYLTSSFAAGNRSTSITPAIQAANVLFSSITSTSINVNWTNGNGSNRIVIVRKGQPVNAIPQTLQFYSANPTYGNINCLVLPENYSVYNSTGNSVPVSGLTSGTTYHFAVFEFNGFFGPVYNQTLVATGNATTLGAPTDPAQNIFFTASGQTSLQIRWTNGSGQKRLVMMKEDAPVNAIPVNSTNYNGNSFFTGGSEVGTGNFAVYAGSSDNVTVTNLTPGKLYHVAVFEFNSFPSGNMYLVNNPATALWAGGPLPVKLLSFTGVAEPDKNKLHWKTAFEINSKDFTIERSLDGLNFLSAGKVDAAGTSTTTRLYNFEDAATATKTFYRLRMTDMDGKEELSKVVVIDRTNQGEKFSLYPTRSIAQVTLKLFSDKMGLANVVITDQLGKIINRKNFNVAIGENKIPVNIIHLAPGQYYVLVKSREGSHRAPFIKL